MKKIVLALCTLFISSFSNSQDSIKVEKKRLWSINSMFGINTIYVNHSPKQSNTSEASFGFGFTYNVKRTVFLARYFNTSEFCTFPNVTPIENIYEASLLLGKSKYFSNFSSSFFL